MLYRMEASPWRMLRRAMFKGRWMTFSEIRNHARRPKDECHLAFLCYLGLLENEGNHWRITATGRAAARMGEFQIDVATLKLALLCLVERPAKPDKPRRRTRRAAASARK